jgi:hypothetical protein
MGGLGLPHWHRGASVQSIVSPAGALARLAGVDMARDGVITCTWERGCRRREKTAALEKLAPIGAV